jgi:hypothetical protein
MIPSSQLCYRLLVLSVLLVGVSMSWAEAADVVPQSELNPAPTFEPRVLPTPLEVPGKEYSNDVDKNGIGTPNPGQTVHWQGDGATVWDSFDYHVAGAGVGNGPIPFETDALANIRDKYFLDLDGTRPEVLNPEDQHYYRDTVSLAVSLQKTGSFTDGYQNNVYASRSAMRGGGAEPWALWQANINKKAGALDDLDGLEMFGPGEVDDANMYSRTGDADPDGLGRVSVFRFHPDQTGVSGLSVPYLRTATLLNAVIKDDGARPNWSLYGNGAGFDLDGLMVWDVADDDEFGPGDKVLFSIRPIDNLFDGGEIWLYEYNNLGIPATFLVQGLNGANPRVWNTANQVSMHFFGDNLHGENIDALEAVAPEPSTLVLLAVAGLAGVLFGRRRFRS